MNNVCFIVFNNIKMYPYSVNRQSPYQRSFEAPRRHSHYRPDPFSQRHKPPALLLPQHLNEFDPLPDRPYDVYPEDLVFLMRNQQKNINLMKEKIQKEKAKAENDFAIYKAEIDHLLQDAKLSVQAELDRVYKDYITKYAQLKGQVQQLRLLRKQVLHMNNPNYRKIRPNSHYRDSDYDINDPNRHKQSRVSNKDLINQIQRDAQNIQHQRIYGYLNQLQRQKIQPLLTLAEQLMIVSASGVSFYRSKEMNAKLQDSKEHFQNFLRTIYDTLSYFVISPQELIEKHTQPILVGNDTADLADSKHFDTSPHPPSPGHRLQGVSPNQQVGVTKYCEQIKASQIQKIVCDHNDSILCMAFIDDQYIATGSKDATVNIYTIDGKKLRTLKGHQAAICCLATVKNANGSTILASGGDHGCSSLILWDTNRTWSALHRVKSHTAAVTAIVDLQDGRHVATGSYDKTLNIFNMTRGQIVITLNNNSTSVSSMAMSVNGSRLISSGLDRSLSVWNISRHASGIVERIQNQQTIKLNEVVCQIQTSILKPQLLFCACKDGTLKIVNIFNGNVLKNYAIRSSSLIELVAIEREMKPDLPLLLSCAVNDSELAVTNMETGAVGKVTLTGGLGLDYGLGIGPKVILSTSRGGLLGVVNQRSANRELTLYQIQPL